ncbi:MAG: hypothetical protein K2W96_19845 [Gemmataceae bacterium]|nr:hypothetical protein [Gemmataceae bacterium]
MAEVTIRLIPDPETGKKNIIVSMRSDEDALPHEHENMHRALADKIIQGGLAKAGELGKIIVERLNDEKEPAAPQEVPPERTPQAQGQGR